MRTWHQSDISLVSKKGRYVTKIREKEFNGGPGIGALLLFLGLFFVSCYWLYESVRAREGLWMWGSVLGMIVAIIGLAGLFVVNPNQAKVLQLFGDYRGTHL